MSLSQPVPWRRILAESVAIVASILLAFAIDAAWDTYQQEQELREILVGLREEAQANQHLLTEASSDTQQAMDRLRRFRSGSLEEYKEVDSSDFYQEIYLPFVRGWTATFQVGFLEATISSGKLALIPDPATRAALTSLSADIGSLEQLTRELERMGAEAAETIGRYPRVRQIPGAVETDTLGMLELRRDVRLQGLASARIIFFGGYWFTLERGVSVKITEVIRLLDQSLESLR